MILLLKNVKGESKKKTEDRAGTASRRAGGIEPRRLRRKEVLLFAQEKKNLKRSDST